MPVLPRVGRTALPGPRAAHEHQRSVVSTLAYQRQSKHLRNVMQVIAAEALTCGAGVHAASAELRGGDGTPMALSSTQ
jgi:hypothetical protein